MNANQHIDDYYSWLVSLVSAYDYDVECYQLLLEKLYYNEFYPVIDRDGNRVSDGLSLRQKFDENNNIPFDGPYIISDRDHSYCSILEMMIALSMRIEYDIKYDQYYGDRTAQWFWVMIENLDLTDMDDDHYDDYKVCSTLYSFINREYEPSGLNGNIFYTMDPEVDLRDMEIWYQANHFLLEFFD